MSVFINPLLSPLPPPITPLSVVSQKFQQSGSRVRNPNYGRSPRLAGSSHSPQAAPTSPHQPPFTSLTSPKTLPHSPTSPRPGLQPESGQNWENDLLLVYRGRGMPGMGQRISAMPRILRMRVSRVRAGPQPRRGDRGISRTGPASLPGPRHLAILAPQGDQGSHTHFLQTSKLPFSPLESISVGQQCPKVSISIECAKGGAPGPSSGVLVKGWVVPCAVWRGTEVVPSVAKLHLL